VAITKFTPDRQPRHDDPNAAMTVWQILLLFFDWINSNYVAQFKSGSSTVPNGSTTLVVSHGLGVASYRAELTPLQDPGGRYWVSNKTGSQFQINLSVVAPVGGIAFDWLVKGD
jgi:hypothetical protein